MLKKVIATVVLLCSCVMLVPAFESKAADYTINMSRPEATTNSGYVELLQQKKSDGAYIVIVFFWNSWGVDGNKTVDVHVTASSLQLTAYDGYITLFNMTSDGRDNPAVATSGQKSHKYDASAFGYNLVGYRVYGNVGACTTTIGGYTLDWNVLYVQEAVEVYKLTQIYTQLVQANANDTTMINKINQIYNSLDTVESKLQQLIDLQEESNTWLEKIFNYLNESQEQQKQEAQTQGNSSVSQGSSAIEDKGGDFAGSLSGLTNSMSYTGTDCSWTFPTVKLPAIPGVMDEVTLIESQPIDFSFWVNAIPSGIMLIIQSVLTIGLIVYCFKELYSTIAYVLTLRKDDNS